jgi:hypothetical protein
MAIPKTNWQPRSDNCSWGDPFGFEFFIVGHHLAIMLLFQAYYAARKQAAKQKKIQLQAYYAARKQAAKQKKIQCVCVY